MQDLDVNDLYVGQRIRYSWPDHGYDNEPHRQHLKLGQIYTISDFDVGGSYTSIYLREFPYIAFNSVAFSSTEETD